jgi:glutathione S-transferase
MQPLLHNRSKGSAPIADPDSKNVFNRSQMKLIIARPSPYARKARIALLEKGLAFETVVENPWLPDTRMPGFNPLGKVPALVLDDGRVIHDSKVIVEYLETLNASPALIPDSPQLRIEHKQIEAIADGVCDAVVLIRLEGTRPKDKQSADWVARQHKKIVAGTAELSRLLGQREWFTAHGFGLADVATGCTLGYLDFRYPEYDWRKTAPNLERLHARLAVRPSFVQSVPQAQEMPVTR